MSTNATLLHEPGHGVPAYLAGADVTLRLHTNDPVRAGSCVLQWHEKVSPVRILLGQLVCSYGGYLAANPGPIGFFRRVLDVDGACEDMATARDTARELARQTGFPESEICDVAEKTARTILAQEWQAVRALAQILDHHGFVEPEMVRKVVANPNDYMLGWRPGSVGWQIDRDQFDPNTKQDWRNFEATLRHVTRKHEDERKPKARGNHGGTIGAESAKRRAPRSSLIPDYLTKQQSTLGDLLEKKLRELSACT